MRSTCSRSLERLSQRGPVSVLDVGCGIGMMGGYRFSRHPSVSRVTGIDIEPNALELARQHFSTEKTEYEVADFMTYRPASPFDLVYCSHVLYSTPRSPACHRGTLGNGGARGGELSSATPISTSIFSIRLIAIPG